MEDNVILKPETIKGSQKRLRARVLRAYLTSKIVDREKEMKEQCGKFKKLQV